MYWKTIIVKAPERQMLNPWKRLPPGSYVRNGAGMLKYTTKEIIRQDHLREKDKSTRTDGVEGRAKL